MRFRLYLNPQLSYNRKNSIMRHQYVPIFITLLCSLLGFGQGLENFDNSNATASYADNNFLGNNGVSWNYIESRDENGDANSSGINGNALMLRSIADFSKITSSPVAGGIGDFSVKLYKGFTGGGNRQVELFVNGVYQGASIPFDDYNEHIFSVTGIDLGGNVTIELRNITNSQVIVDDIEWSSYTGLPNPELQLVDNIGSNQSCGYFIDFGSQPFTSNTDLTFDIKNIGIVNLDISSITITGDYSIVSPTTPITITSGTSQMVTVGFNPSTVGTKNGLLTINNNDSNEGSCIVNITGFSFVPTPEIDIERSTFSSIPNGSLPNIGYSTVFASTVIGDFTAPRTFHVSSEGSANLDLTSITSSNPGEFLISLNPAPQTLTAGDKVDFEITFAPSGIGLRTTIITILSNDTDENPYIFNIQGVGTCSSGALTSLPNNAPVGTIVNITSTTTNFGGSTFVSVNSISASVTVLSSNELEVTIPAGATTGSIEVKDDLGCLSSNYFTVIDQLISDCEGSSGSIPTDLFISEITDHGTGSHTYVEIFNGTGSAVSLADYQIRLHNNGATSPTHTIPLIGSIANNRVFVLAFGALEASNPHGIYTADQTDNATGINNNDHIRLFNSTTNTWIDLWGDISGDVFAIASKSYNYRRKNSGIIAPSTTWSETDWTSFTPVNYDDVGNFDFSIGTPPVITIQPNISSNNCDLSASISVSATEGFPNGNVLSYQWYVSAPGTLDWTTISNGATYTGANSHTLNVLNTLNLDNYQYYCQVREDSARCYTASETVRLKVEQAIWTGSGWSTTPTIDKIAILDANYDTSNGTNGQISFDACRLIVNSGSTLIINSSDYVNVNFNITNNGDITIENSGSLIQVNDFDTNTGNITMKRSTNIRRLDYVYWSAPLQGYSINDIYGAGTPTHKIYRWNTTITNPEGSQGNWVAASGEAMQPGEGYIVRGPDSYSATNTNITATFNNGKPFNGFITRNVSRGNLPGVDDNWNLVGNPYPSAINVVDFLTNPTNSAVLDGFVNIWTHGTLPSKAIPDPFYDNFGSNYTTNDYITHNGTGTTSGPSVFNGKIAAGQSFMVNMVNGPAVTQPIEFRNNMRNITHNNSQFYKTKQPDEKHRIWLDLVSQNTETTRILIGYILNATFERDRVFDAITDNSNFYSLIVNENFVIQGRPLPFTDTDVIHLGVKITSQGNHIIAIAAIDGLFETGNQTIYLKDNLLSIVHSISNSPYNFTSEKGEFNNRFEIVFRNNALSLNNSTFNTNNLTIIEINNDIMKFSLDAKTATIKSVEIIDMLGRTLYKLKGSSNTETYNLSNLRSAAFMAKVTLSNNQILVKKAVKK